MKRQRGFGYLEIGAAIAALVLLASIAWLPGHDFDSVTRWLASPVAAIPMLLLIISVFYHFRLGLQLLM